MKNLSEFCEGLLSNTSTGIHAKIKQWLSHYHGDDGFTEFSDDYRLENGLLYLKKPLDTPLVILADHMAKCPVPLKDIRIENPYTKVKQVEIHYVGGVPNELVPEKIPAIFIGSKPKITNIKIESCDQIDSFVANAEYLNITENIVIKKLSGKYDQIRLAPGAKILEFNKVQTKTLNASVNHTNVTTFLDDAKSSTIENIYLGTLHKWYELHNILGDFFGIQHRVELSADLKEYLDSVIEAFRTELIKCITNCKIKQFQVVEQNNGVFQRMYIEYENQELTYSIKA